jgi:hypothetical protein
VAEDEKAAQLFAQVHQKLKTARSPQDYRVVVPYLEKLSTELRPNFVKIPFASKTDWTRCLPGGRYRAEIYLNGRLSPHQPAAQNSAGNFACWKLFDLNLALCCPENWRPLSVLTNVKDAPLEVRIDSYLARGLATDKIDGKPAAFFFTFYPSMSGGSTPQEREAEAVKTAKALLTRWKWLDEGAVCNRYDPTRGCDSETPSGEVEYRYWETDEGVQHVGLVLLAAAPLNDLSHTLHSVSNLYRPLKVAGAGP